MFPFQRSASDFIFLIYDFECLNAMGGLFQYKNAPGNKFATWKHMRISDAQSNIILRDAGIGFILVIDRRQDKWTSVKASILRIA
uniref:Uncharacterized protein n=1 Tax=Strix occidentalis caurina TaxID=311401 RepID=A0A8D0FZX2_STROC